MQMFCRDGDCFSTCRLCAEVKGSEWKKKIAPLRIDKDLVVFLSGVVFLRLIVESLSLI